MSRVIGFVYAYSFYVTSFLSLLSLVMLFGGIAALKCAAAERHCTVPFGKLAAARQPILMMLVSDSGMRAGPCGTRVTKASLIAGL